MPGCEETLYLHGSTGRGPLLAAKAATASGSGLPVCVTVTLVDGLVLARSAMHHSVNFRSVVVVGDARVVDDPAEKSRALSCLLDHIAPGRAADCRAPDARELAATGVLALDLVEVSAKVRSGPPVDDPQDLSLPHWAGVVPLSLTAGTPVPADDLDPGDRAAARIWRARAAGSGRPASPVSGSRRAAPSPASGPAGRPGRRRIPTGRRPAPRRSPGCCA